MKKWKILLGVAVFVALALALAACGEEEEAPATPTPTETATVTETATPAEEEVTLTVLVPAMPFGIDRDLSHGNIQTWESIPNCYDMAFMFDRIPYPFADPPEGQGVGHLDFSTIEPWLFESAEFSADGSTATIKIRPGVLSAAGNELTSEDVKWTMDRSKALQAIGAFFIQVMNLTDDPIEIVDKYTFKIHSKGPQALLESIWTNSYFPVFDSTEAKKHATADDPWATNWLPNNCAGFGAYYVESWEEGNQVIWRANPNYFQGKPQIDRVIYRVVPDSSVRFSALRAGEADIVEGLSPDEWLAAKDLPGVKAIAVRSNIIIFAYMNSKMEPFDDIKVRQAFNYAMPRKEISESVYLGLAQPWQTAYAPIFPGADPSLWPYGDKPDFEKAKQLLAEAGYAGGLDVTLNYSTAIPQNEPMAILIQDSLAQIGVNVTLNPMADGDFAAGSTTHTLAFGLWLDSYIQPDPIYQLELAYSSTFVNNFGQLDDPQLNSIIAECKTKVDLQERVECTKPAQARALELAGYAWLANPYYTIAIRDNIEGFTWYNTQFFRFQDLTKK